DLRGEQRRAQRLGEDLLVRPRAQRVDRELAAEAHFGRLPAGYVDSDLVYLAVAVARFRREAQKVVPGQLDANAGKHAIGVAVDPEDRSACESRETTQPLLCQIDIGVATGGDRRPCRIELRRLELKDVQRDLTAGGERPEPGDVR